MTTFLQLGVCGQISPCYKLPFILARDFPTVAYTKIRDLL